MHSTKTIYKHVCVCPPQLYLHYQNVSSEIRITYWLQLTRTHTVDDKSISIVIYGKFGELGSGGNPVEIEQKNRSSLLEKAINAYCNVYYSNKIFKS